MKLIEQIQRVHQVERTPYGVLFSIKEDKEWGKVKCIKQLIGNKIKTFFNEPSYFFTTLNDKLFVQQINGKDIILLFDNCSKTVLEGQYFLIFNQQSLPNHLKLLTQDEELNQTFFLFEKNYKLKQVQRLYDLQIEKNFIFKGFSTTTVECYTLDEKLIWSTDATQFGRDIMRDRETSEILSDQPNEISGDIFSYKNLVYLFMKGGQLVALNAEDGSLAWMWEHERTGAFMGIEEKVYKQDGKSIFEIDAIKGKLLRELHYSDNSVLEGYHSSGPLWVYEDVIVTVDVLYGKICIIDRKNFEVFDFFSLNKRLINSNNALVWHDNKLYVLDIDNTLHIFEKE